MLVELFDWLDGLEPQLTTKIIYLYDMTQTIEAKSLGTLTKLDQAAAKQAETDGLMVAFQVNLK